MIEDNGECARGLKELRDELELENKRLDGRLESVLELSGRDVLDRTVAREFGCEAMLEEIHTFVLETHFRILLEEKTRLLSERDTLEASCVKQDIGSAQRTRRRQRGAQKLSFQDRFDFLIPHQ
eukprot:CAMPEP_0182443314 /NCGR_PEP_ID=MMETSP1172-20130603/2081_1 /TAXON_ID=708627 /ORGANISM="Timspurckia oligopyrenoides, Strain CCMP3278" /LENGTH=123 /DNA_ID=CAMNT_0024638551 /DNA_START=275 /DNA_END=646 /DNA_ORIENTATION=+